MIRVAEGHLDMLESVVLESIDSDEVESARVCDRQFDSVVWYGCRAAAPASAQHSDLEPPKEEGAWVRLEGANADSRASKFNGRIGDLEWRRRIDDQLGGAANVDSTGPTSLAGGRIKCQTKPTASTRCPAGGHVPYKVLIPEDRVIRQIN